MWLIWSPLWRICSGGPLASGFSSCVHWIMSKLLCSWLQNSSLFFPLTPPPPSGSLLPYHPDASLWQGLQNVQQDFPLTRARHHRPSWRQWVVANIFSTVTCSCRSMVIQSCVAFGNEISLSCHCNSADIKEPFFLAFKPAVNFLKELHLCAECQL